MTDNDGNDVNIDNSNAVALALGFADAVVPSERHPACDAGAPGKGVEEGGGKAGDAGAGIQKPADDSLGSLDLDATAAAARDPHFGITQAALLAPVPPPPKKKRKTQDEFTIDQKLVILSELRGPRALPVPLVAAKHGTSRTSIYRWKKDASRLARLAGKGGKGGYKRVAHTRRKGFNEEFTAAEKLAVVRELNGDDPPSVRALAERCGANHRSIYRWKKDEARLARLVEEEGRGGCKRSGGDPLYRIKEALKRFHAENYAVKADGAPSLAITGTVVATKAKQIRDDMLAQHERRPFLTTEEANGMREFTASGSWGRKMVNKFGWKGSGDDAPAVSTHAAAPANTDSPDDSNAAALTLAAPFACGKGKKPKKTQRMAQKVAEMKREMTSLRTKLGQANAQIGDLEADNARLRAHLATVYGGGERVSGREPPVVATAAFDILNAPPTMPPNVDETDACGGAFADSGAAVGAADEQDFHIDV